MAIKEFGSGLIGKNLDDTREEFRNICFPGLEEFEKVNLIEMSGTWYAGMATKINNKKDKIIGYLLILRDVTEMKNYQEELIEARKSAEEGKAAAEEANIIKRQFLTNISYEIMTPMNGIIGFIEMFDKNKLDLEQNEILVEAKQSADILMNLINDILDFSKIEAGKLSIENVDFSLKTTIYN